MSDEDALHRIIAKFMLNTCRCRVKQNPISLRQLEGEFINTLVHNILGDGEALFKSGSFAELYIRPILHCYGDIDIMHSHMTELAIPFGTLPHTETWYCHQDTVTVYEIIESHKPGCILATVVHC